MAHQIVVVDPDPAVLERLAAVVGAAASTEGFTEFRAARARILAAPLDLLLTNLRLGAFNGLHLVFLATPATRCVVYTPGAEPAFVPDVQFCGAFYEPLEVLPQTLPSHLAAVHASVTARVLSR
jgi:DNA-binding NtrC family response regulator